MISKYQDELKVPIMQRRFAVRKEDPVEELHDLYGEIKDQETKFRKILEVCGKKIISFMIV